MGADVSTENAGRNPEQLVADNAVLARRVAELETTVQEQQSVLDLLRQSDAHYRALVQHTLDIIALINAQGQVLYYGPSIEQILGYHPDELVGRTIYGALHPDDVVRVRDAIAALVHQPGTSLAIEYRVRHRDGSWRAFEAIGSSPQDTANAGCIIVNARDITGRLHAQRALQESEERFRNLVEGSIQGIVVHRDNQPLFANQAFAEMFGYATPEDVLRLQSIVHTIAAPHERERLRRYGEDRVRGEQVPTYYEFQGVRQDGSNVWVENRVRVVSWDGAPAVQLTVFDVTERKRAEETLRLAQFAMDHGSDAAFWVGSDGQFLYVNEAACRSLGYTREELLALTVHDIDPNFPQEGWAEFWEQIKDVVSFTFESCHRTKDAQVFPVEITTSYLNWNDHEFQCAFARDITERKQAEEAIRAGESHYQHLAEIGKIISSSLDIDAVYHRFAEEVRELIPFDRIMIALIDAERDTSTVAYSFGDPVASRRRGMSYPLANSLAAEVLRRSAGLCVAVEDPTTVPDGLTGLQPLVQAGYRSFLATPLISHDQTIGGLFIASRTPEAYTEQELRLAESVSSQIAGAIVNAQHYGERQRTEAALRESEERYRRLVELSPEPMCVHDGTQIFYINPAGATLFGVENPQQLVGASIWDLVHPDEQRMVRRRLRSLRQTAQQLEPIELRCVRSDGQSIYVEASAVAITHEGRPAVQSVARDITERKLAEHARQRLEEQLRQAQKMEAIGTLAGGIAHEFNNILGVILGFAELTHYEVPQGSRASENVEEVLKAGWRARDLVQQILTFGRMSDPNREPLRIASVVQEVLALLRASLPTTIEIRQESRGEDDVVHANRTQMHQILMNLCANAEYAMRESGGVLTIGVETVEVDATLAAAHSELQPGPHVCLTVHDTGHGMIPEVAERIFEPFFTTKGVGEGTGMGLAIVHGIVASHGGAATVYSRPGEGTTFAIYLPCSAEAVAAEHQALELVHRGKGCILLVDDEEALERVGQAFLRRLGYEVVSRRDSREALEAFRATPQRFDLVITDQTMPHMTGEMLARELRRLRPDIPIILCTGFSHVIDAEKARALGIDAFVMKPIVMHEFARTIQQVVDDRSQGRPKARGTGPP